MTDRPNEDLLSTVLNAFQLSARVLLHHSLNVDWPLPSFGGHRATFHIIGGGRCWLHMDGKPNPTPLSKGQVALVTRDIRHFLSNTADPNTPFCESKSTLVGESPKILCGFFDFGAGPSNLLIDALPELVIVSLEDDAICMQLEILADLLLQEAEQPRFGSRLCLDRLADVLFILLLRRFLEQSDPHRGLLAGFADHRIYRALLAMHREPGRNWQVESLADIAGMSRTAFAQRFNTLLGKPPLGYLTAWRMHQAERWLREDRMPVAQVAEQLGYSTEAAFRRAFKRARGIGPGQLRKGRRDDRRVLDDEQWNPPALGASNLY